MGSPDASPSVQIEFEEQMVTGKTLAAWMALSVIAFAQAPPAASIPPVEQEVKGRTIVSKTLPAADLAFEKGYRYVGSQRVNLYGNADAEQHLFVKAAIREQSRASIGFSSSTSFPAIRTPTTTP